MNELKDKLTEILNVGLTCLKYLKLIIKILIAIHARLADSDMEYDPYNVELEEEANVLANKETKIGE